MRKLGDALTLLAMRAVLVLLGWLVACSSSESNPSAGQAGSGGSSAGIAGAVAGSPPDGGTENGGSSAQAGTAGAVGAGESGGGETTDGGTDGGAGMPEAGGSSGQAGGGAAGAGGGGSSSGGAGASGMAGAVSDAGAGGADTGPDPCQDVPHWSAEDRWTDYGVDELRVFGGRLWKAVQPLFCHTYPGHGAPEGWVEAAVCKGGPIDEQAECQCNAGTCCDGCYLRARSYSCGEVARYARCTMGEPFQCTTGTDRIEHDYWNLFCNGDGTECTRWAAHTKYVSSPCGKMVCIESGDQAACVECPD